ncbi:MAG: alanine/glycine:cation symporter family protein [Fusobacteriaceae bacterium]
MKELEVFFENLANLIWGNWLLITLVAIGAYFTISTKFLTIIKLPQILKMTIYDSLMNNKKLKGNGTITPFQALCTALASCVGNGNIIGVTTAIVGGGPGAIFWMWVAGILGMATKYSEILLGIYFREKNSSNEYVGGPMYYIEKGMKLKWLGMIYAFLMILQISGGNLIQSNAISSVAKNTFGVSPILTAIIITFSVGIVIVGGIKKLAHFSEKLVPSMALIYIITSIIVLIFNYQNILPSLKLIFTEAFNFKAGVSGAVGYSVRNAMRYGIARGLYSNEAGEGSAPVLHSAAITDHPARQAFFGITEVFIDTIIICSLTALVVLSSGVLEEHKSSNLLVGIAFGNVSPFFKYLVSICMLLFAYSSILAQWYFGVVGTTYLLGAELAKSFKYPFLIFSILGALSSFKLVWFIQDSILGLLIIPNLIALVYLEKIVREQTKDFFHKHKI